MAEPGTPEALQTLAQEASRAATAAVARIARARIDQARGAGPRSAVPALDEWLASFREHAGESKLPFALPSTGPGGAE
jgi:hypothetical protein